MRIKIDTEYDIKPVELWDVEILPPIGTLIFLNSFFDNNELDNFFKDTDENYTDEFILDHYLLDKDERGIFYNLMFIKIN